MEELSLYSLLAQAGAAFAGAKSPGQGGSLFEAMRNLEVLRQRNRQAMEAQLPWKKNKL